MPVQFCNEFVDLVQANPGIVNALLTSDEAYFHLSGYMNKQNFQYWPSNNPNESGYVAHMVKQMHT